MDSWMNAWLVYQLEALLVSSSSNYEKCHGLDQRVYFSPMTRVLVAGNSAQQPSHVRPASLQSCFAPLMLTEGCHSSRQHIHVPGWTKRGKDSERDVYLFYQRNELPGSLLQSHWSEPCPT